MAAAIKCESTTWGTPVQGREGREGCELGKRLPKGQHDAVLGSLSWCRPFGSLSTQDTER